jgi:hypothetical protein
MKRKRGYDKIFRDVNGNGPWPCYYGPCDRLVEPDELHIHHIDENPANNAPENLASMHRPCHLRLHLIGSTRPPYSDESRQKMREAKLGKPHVERRVKCGDCDLVTMAGPLISHQRATSHQGRMPLG